MELEPEGNSTFPEEATDFVRIHRVVVIDGLYTTSETLCISTTDVRDFPNRKSPIYGFYLFAIPYNRRTIGLVEVSEHLRPDTRRRYTDGYWHSDIVVDISLEVFGEYFIVIRHPIHTREGLIDREYFELPETGLEIAHESLRDFSVILMIWESLHELSSRDELLGFPERSSDTDPETLRFIACSYRDLITDEDTFALELRISEYFTRSIK
jgi:hypothetical protein